MSTEVQPATARHKDADDLVLESRDAQETRALGAILGAQAVAGSAILLTGELGSGKTVLAQGIGAGLGVSTVVNSPTYVLVNEHLSGRLPLLHADLYRLSSREEIAELALHETAEGGVLVLEWPERAGPDLPEDHLAIRLNAGRAESHRTIRCRATGPRSRALLAYLRETRPQLD